ncbi:MAG: TraR/DksA family transcriptional regulator [Usitatibacter sp.]
MNREHTYITQEQREALHARLQRRAEALREEIRAGLHSESLREDTRENATDDVEASVQVASVERDIDELREIEGALERMAASTYGLCVECAVALPWVRLDARPEAKRCMRCETEHEQRRAQRGPPGL